MLWGNPQRPIKQAQTAEGGRKLSAGEPRHRSVHKNRGSPCGEPHRIFCKVNVLYKCRFYSFSGCQIYINFAKSLETLGFCICYIPSVQKPSFGYRSRFVKLYSFTNRNINKMPRTFHCAGHSLKIISHQYNCTLQERQQHRLRRL